MISLLRRCLLLFTGCLLSLSASAQKADIIPAADREQLRHLPVAARDTVYLRWGGYYYACYNEEGLDKALECYHAALQIATRYRHEDVVHRCYYSLGAVYDALNNFSKATQYYQLSFTDELQSGDPKRIFRSAYNLATVASKAGDRNNVRKYALLMERYLKDIMDLDYRVKGNLLLANLYSRNGDTVRFLRYYRLLPEDAPFKDGGLAFGRLYAETKSNYLRYKGAGSASLAPLYEELSHTRDSVPLLTLLAKGAEETGDYQQALYMHKLLDRTVAAHTSNALRENIDKRAQFMDNELVAHKNQLLLLQQDHLLQQRRLLYGIAGMLLIGFLIATYSFFRIKAQHKKIGAQSEQIRRQHDNIEVLLREVHHRVKNNLQIINSAVELQQLKQDVSPADSIKEMQVKMQSIALAHELAYEQAHIEYVPLQEYFSRLFAIMLRIYALRSDQLACRIDTAGLKLNLDKILLLALAVNELIINTIKHAYPGKDVCMIDIKCTVNEDWYTFCYSDNGPGLPAGADTGNGIGTRLVRRLIKQLGGTVQVKNDIGKLEYIFTFTP